MKRFHHAKKVQEDQAKGDPWPSTPKGLNEYPNPSVEMERLAQAKALIIEYEQREEAQKRAQYVKDTTFPHHLSYPPPRQPLRIHSVVQEEIQNGMSSRSSFLMG